MQNVAEDKTTSVITCVVKTKLISKIKRPILVQVLPLVLVSTT